jgi:hypothetical protein
MSTSSINQYKRLQAVLGTTIDGIPGPKDDAAYRALRRKVEEEQAKLSVPSDESSLGAAIVRVAREAVGVSEVTKNQAPEIAKYWSATDYSTGMQNREPWCAAFVCWCIREGARDFGLAAPWPLPKTARAFGFDDEWAVRNTIRVTKTPAATALKPGDVVVFRFSHVGIYVGPVNSTSILTIEGNTNGEGSREGDGVYQKIRPISLVRSAVHIS